MSCLLECTLYVTMNIQKCSAFYRMQTISKCNSESLVFNLIWSTFICHAHLKHCKGSFYVPWYYSFVFYTTMVNSWINIWMTVPLAFLYFFIFNNCMLIVWRFFFELSKASIFNIKLKSSHRFFIFFFFKKSFFQTRVFLKVFPVNKR